MRHKAKRLGTYDINADKAGWLKLRRAGFGGSDMAALMGHDKTRGPFTIYLTKIDESEPGPQEQNEAAYWGTILEDVVAQEFAKRNGYTIRKVNAILQHPTYPFMVASVDRLVNEGSGWRSLLECKTRSAFVSKEWAGAIPDSVRDQVMHYLIVTGFDHAWVAALVGGQQLRQYYVEYDPAYAAEMVEVAGALWDRVQRRDPPDMDGLESTCTGIDIMYPEAEEGKSIELVGHPREDAEQLLERYKAAKLQGAIGELQAKSLQNELKLLMGDAERVTVMGETVLTWANSTQERVDVRALREEMPEVAARYIKESEFRVMRLKGKK